MSASLRVLMGTLTNIVLVDISVDETKLRFVFGIFERRLDDLVHGCDSSPASDHKQVRGEGASVISPGLPMSCVQAILTNRRICLWAL